MTTFRDKALKDATDAELVEELCNRFPNAPITASIKEFFKVFKEFEEGKAPLQEVCDLLRITNKEHQENVAKLFGKEED